MLPDNSKKVSPYFAFFLNHKIQIGVGILGFERYIAQSAGHDAWVAIIIAGLSINVIIWLCFRILMKGKNDIIGIQKELFGKWIGGMFSFYFVIYFFCFVVTLVRTYVEVIQVWMFPHMYTWVLSSFLLILGYCYVSGGFRTVTGICFLGIIYTFPLLLLKLFPLAESHISNLRPLFDHPFSSYLSATKAMALEYLGFETLLMYYPFLKTPEKAIKWAHFGNLFSILIYLITAITTFLYYNEEELTRTIWATLTLWKIVDFPFMERFEYAGIALWLFAVLPNICLALWATSRGGEAIVSFQSTVQFNLYYHCGRICLLFYRRTAQYRLVKYHYINSRVLHDLFLYSGPICCSMDHL